MKKILHTAVIPAAVAATMMLAACGGDSSSNSSNVEREEDESSSSVEESSSSTDEEESSSSKADLPKETRAATLEDLEKNLYLGKMFGTDVYLATGAKVGVFSLWIPDTAWVAVRSEFKDGVLEYSTANGAFMGVSVPVADSLQAFFEKGGKFQFVVNEKDSLQYSLNDGKYVTVTKADVMVQGNMISKGEDLRGKKLTCKSGDTSRVYSFYKGRFLAEESVGDSSSWSAGYYDIQRSRLLMLPEFFNKSAHALTTAYLSSDYEMRLATGGSSKCESSEFKYSEISRDSIAAASGWVSDEGGLNWMLKLPSSKSKLFTVSGTNMGDPAEYREGRWDIYGDLLLFINTTCSEPRKAVCPSGVKGIVSDFKPNEGFTYKHDDTTSSPKLPTKWTAPVME